MAQRSLAQTLRQHHGIEHATVTLLSQRLPGTQIVAHSDPAGFLIFGELETAALRAAAEEAVARLQRGEAGLAVHPNCGTNLVTAGVLSGAAAWLAGSGRDRPWWDRLSSAVLGATMALFVAGPLGRWMQENVTTTGAVAGLCIADVVKLADGPATRHRVIVRAAP